MREYWNLTNQEAVREVHRAYLEAGSDVLQTNTFPGNRIHLERFGLGEKLMKSITGEPGLQERLPETGLT